MSVVTLHDEVKRSMYNLYTLLEDGIASFLVQCSHNVERDNMYTKCDIMDCVTYVRYLTYTVYAGLINSTTL